MFEYPFIKEAAYYKVYLAYDELSKDSTDFSSVFQVFIDSTEAVMVNNLEMGRAYKWMVEVYSNAKVMCISRLPVLPLPLP